MKQMFLVKRLTTLLFATGIAITAFSQADPSATLVEEIKKSSDGFNIPYKKYTYPNGLTLLIHEDHSDPVVYTDVTYHVGSAREVSGRSGFAHFFEHMMFQGSDHVADEEHFKIVTESGGTLNGTTNTDRTNYFETMPANQLETALWLEADRMGFFLDAVTNEKFEVQRATVKNERGQNYDNRPYGLVTEKINEVLYPFNHPYSWTTIGYIADLNAADLQDLKNFFLRWYGPNNATVTVAGDVNSDQVTKLVAKYFGSIPRCPEVKNMKPVAAVLNENRYISYEDNIKFPMLKMVFPGAEARSADEPALDALAEVLGGGKSSLMYQKFVKTQFALRASASNPTAELAGNMEFTITVYPGKTLAEAEKMLREVFVDFEKKGISDEELERFKAKHEANTINSLQSVQGKGSQLASFQTMTGNPNYIVTDLKNYMKVTKEDVMRVYNKYIKGKHAAILSVVPKGKTELIAAPDNAKRPETPAGFKNDLSQYQNLKYNKGKDNFDRSKRPTPGANPLVKVPAFWNNTLGNGMKVIGTPFDELPRTEIRIYIKGGQLMETFDKAGLAQLTASMLNESTDNYTSEGLDDALDKLGSDVSIFATQEDLVVTMNCLNKHLDATIKLMEERMFHPKFDASEFDRIKNEQLQGIQNQQTNAGAISRNVFRKVMYGADNIFSLNESGTEASVKNINIQDVKDFYNKYFSPDVAKMIIVGNLTDKDFAVKLKFLSDWKAKGLKLPAKKPATGVEKTTIYFANKDNAAQSEIILGLPALNYDALGEYYRSGIMNYPLGGAFNSRINLNLREKHGFTYGARAGFNGTDYVNLYTGSAGVKWEATDSSVIEFMNEISEFLTKGIRDEEIAFTKSSIGQRDALQYETPGQKAGFMKTIIENNFDKDLIKKQNDILKNISKAELNALAKKYIHLDKMAIVIVGDKKKVFEKVKALGFNVIEMDAYGNKLPQTVKMQEEK